MALKQKSDIKREKTCRICLCDSEVLNSLNDKFGDEQKSVLETINFVVNIVMRLERDLPNQICNDCVAKLYTADIFKRRCLDSEEILGQYHPALAKEEYLEEVSEEEEKNSFLLDDLTNKGDNLAVYANVTITKNKKSKANHHAIEPHITKIENDVTSSIKDETEPFGNDFDDDTEYIVNNEADNLNKSSIKPAKLKKCSIVKDKKNNERTVVKGRNVNKRKENKSALMSVNRDKKAVTAEHGSEYSCKVCGSKYANRDILEEHKKEHSDQQLCPFCGKWIKACNLQDHILRHKKIKAFQCDQCGKSFVSKREVKIHIRSHTGAKPYLCNTCGRRFATGSILHKHRRNKHSDARPYVCEYCQKRFKESSILKRHTLTHTGEKLYKCMVCDEAFNRSYQLTNHLRRRHAKDTPNIAAVMAANIRKPGRPSPLSKIKLGNSELESVSVTTTGVQNL